MVDFQTKKRIRKIMYSPLVLVILTIILLVLLSGVWGVYNKAKLSSANLERERNEVNKLTVRQQNLANSIDYLKTEQGVENEIRTKFRAVKEGEQVAVIVEDKQASTTSTTTKKGFWYNLFHLGE
jgi:cell division protein FtsB